MGVLKPYLNRHLSTSSLQSLPLLVSSRAKSIMIVVHNLRASIGTVTQGRIAGAPNQIFQNVAAASVVEAEDGAHGK